MFLARSTKRATSVGSGVTGSVPVSEARHVEQAADQFAHVVDLIDDNLVELAQLGGVQVG